MGRKVFWFTIVPVERVEEGTDRWAVEHGCISMTPLRLDLTSEEELAKVQAKQPLAGCWPIDQLSHAQGADSKSQP
jgi:5'-nucleotidase